MKTRRHHRLAGAVSAVLLVAAASAPAHAAPPANDSISTPTEITAIPSEFTQDTSEATAERSDGPCVAGRSVWYRYRPQTPQRVRAVTVGSDYDTVLTVFRGPRNDRTRIACNDDRAGLASAVSVRFVAGERYWIAVSSCCSRRSLRGGQAVLTLYRPVGPADVSITLDTVESGGTSGRLLLTGTATCATPSYVEMEVTVSQRVGDAVARGWDFPWMNACTDEPAEWQGAIDSDTGWAFQEGMAVVELRAYSTDGFDFATDELNDSFEVTDNPAGRLVPGRSLR
jgi:hypothetical protein